MDLNICGFCRDQAEDHSGPCTRRFLYALEGVLSTAQTDMIRPGCRYRQLVHNFDNLQACERTVMSDATDQTALDLWTTGPLLRAVQLAPLYNDSKTFVYVYRDRSFRAGRISERHGDMQQLRQWETSAVLQYIIGAFAIARLHSGHHSDVNIHSCLFVCRRDMPALIAPSEILAEFESLSQMSGTNLSAAELQDFVDAHFAAAGR